jgi:hypothetical protein
VGDPHFKQKHLMPLPELNRPIGGLVGATVSLLASAIAHVAGDVPENFLQFAQWQYRTE